MVPAVTISNLRFEYHPTGLGVSTATPRLSWEVAPSDPARPPPDWVQEAYEIKIFRSGQQKTVHVYDAATTLVPWPAEPLRSSERATIRVRSFGRDGVNSDWSDSATVEAALLEQADWTAQYISFPDRTDQPHPLENGTRPVRFRKTFQASLNASRSRLYITALGIYEAYLNGVRIGDECLAPGWTSYQHRIQFQTFDIAPLLVDGSNELVIEVAEGWYTGRLLWGKGVTNCYGEHTAALAQLDQFETPDDIKSSACVQTDETWECALSPIVASGIYDGESYDLGLEYGYHKSNSPEWQPVRLITPPHTTLVASSAPPVRVTWTIRPIAITPDPEGKHLEDFGQNLVGRVRIPALQRPDGHRLVIRHAEVLEHGRLGTRPLRSAKAIDTVIFGGGRALEDWNPRFTFHGFRYIEITGWSPNDMENPLTLDSLVAEAIHSDMRRTGHFRCSDDRVTRLHHNSVWSMRGNFLGVPTDCPQRDERLGWTGDIQAFSPTACYLYDCSGVLTNWMHDLLAEQKEDDGIVPIVIPNVLRYEGSQKPTPNAVWDDVVILLPWNLYTYFGDIDVLRTSWQGMKNYLATLCRDTDGLWDPTIWQFGDWLDPIAPPDNPALGKTDNTLVADLYLVYVTSIMVKIAAVLDLPLEWTQYEQEYRKLQAAFEYKYIAKSGLLVGDSQTSLALSLVFGIHSDMRQREMASSRLARLAQYAMFKVSTGFAGTPVVLDALTQGGHEQVAYRMLLEEGCPSWLYPVSMGATTIWERWDSMLPDGSINPGEMTSFNHYALGSVSNWLHTTVGGLSPIEPGWKRFLVRPIPGGTITSAKLSFHCPSGLITLVWAMSLPDKTLVGRVTVPPNTTAIIKGPDRSRVVGSGEHTFEWTVVNSETWPPKGLGREPVD